MTLQRMSRRSLLQHLGCVCTLGLVAVRVEAVAKKKYWYRICETCRGDARFGPYRDTYKRALLDVKDHLAANPKHSADVYGPVDR
jgi:hypothetical protein